MFIPPLIESILINPLSKARESTASIGFVGFDFPLDIQLSTSQLCFHLPWNKNLSTAQADQWLESSFSGFSRSILQDWIEGKFNFLSSVVFSRGDDATQRLYYYICELQRVGVLSGPVPLILDTGYIARETSLRHCDNSITQLMQELGLSDDDLRSGIVRANQYRNWLANLHSKNIAFGHYYENISRAMLFNDVYASLTSIQFPVSTQYPRVLLAGSAPPDDTLHRSIEEMNWNVVGELHSRSLLRYGQPIVNFEENPVQAIAKSIHQNQFGSRTFCNRSEQLVSLAQQLAVNAVVIWITEEDESLAWQVAKQREALALANIDHLILVRRRWDGNDDSVDKIKTFLKSIIQRKGL
jgi:hypothetical protein